MDGCIQGCAGCVTHRRASAGAANLRKAAHHVRRALGPSDAVVVRGGVVALFPNADVTVDAVEFEAAAEGASSFDALGTYGGDLLPSSPYEEWTQAPRRR